MPSLPPGGQAPFLLGQPNRRETVIKDIRNLISEVDLSNLVVNISSYLQVSFLLSHLQLSLPVLALLQSHCNRTYMSR